MLGVSFENCLSYVFRILYIIIYVLTHQLYTVLSMKRSSSTVTSTQYSAPNKAIKTETNQKNNVDLNIVLRECGLYFDNVDSKELRVSKMKPALSLNTDRWDILSGLSDMPLQIILPWMTVSIALLNPHDIIVHNQHSLDTPWLLRYQLHTYMNGRQRQSENHDPIGKQNVCGMRACTSFLDEMYTHVSSLITKQHPQLFPASAMKDSDFKKTNRSWSESSLSMSSPLFFQRSTYDMTDIAFQTIPILKPFYKQGQTRFNYLHVTNYRTGEILPIDQHQTGLKKGDLVAPCVQISAFRRKSESYLRLQLTLKHVSYIKQNEVQRVKDLITNKLHHKV